MFLRWLAMTALKLLGFTAGFPIVSQRGRPNHLIRRAF